jgi:hypothetical protein
MASYKEAIAWMADMDDNQWLGDDNPIPSVTASMVSDIFKKPMSKVVKDLTKAIWEIDNDSRGNG